MPNFPNYRLGHLEGSPCDTLRQPPTAAFSTTDNGLQWAFTDESYHDIRSWWWTFGDGQSDTLANPTHTYAEAGVYEVCLTVTNPRGEDTVCEEFAVLADGVEEPFGDLRLNVFPNPASDQLHVRWQPFAGNGQLVLVDQLGRAQREWAIEGAKSREVIYFKDLSPGIYYLRMMNRQWETSVKIAIN